MTSTWPELFYQLADAVEAGADVVIYLEDRVHPYKVKGPGIEGLFVEYEHDGSLYVLWHNYETDHAVSPRPYLWEADEDGNPVEKLRPVRVEDIIFEGSEEGPDAPEGLT